MSKLDVKLEDGTGIVVTRDFAAPPEDVYRAHTEPDLIRQWMLGPDGWTMPECMNDCRPGGQMRYVWSNGRGKSFSLTGNYLEVEAFRRLLHVERMHLPGPTPDNRVETTFTAIATGTRMVMRMTLPDEKTRTQMLATGMTEGMEMSYVRLEALAFSATSPTA